MSGTYQVRVLSDEGTGLAILPDALLIDLSFGIAENEIGQLAITLPQSVDTSWLRVDRMLQVERATGAGYRVLSGRLWFLVDWEFHSDESGDYLTLLAFDQIYLLDAPIVLAEPGSPYSLKTGAADDLMRQYVNEAMGPGGDLDRRMAGISISGLGGQAPAASLDAAKRAVLAVLQDLADMSVSAGVYLVFDLVYNGAGGFSFQTFPGFRGADRGASSGSPLYLPLRTASLKVEHSKERNVVYFGRIIGGEQNPFDPPVSDPDTMRRTVFRPPQRYVSNGRLLHASPFRRREMYLDTQSDTTTTSAIDQARAALQANRPRMTLTGEVQEAEHYRFGVDYEFGNVVAVGYGGQVFDCHIAVVAGRYTGGVETLTIGVRGEV